MFWGEIEQQFYANKKFSANPCKEVFAKLFTKSGGEIEQRFYANKKRFNKSNVEKFFAYFFTKK